MRRRHSGSVAIRRKKSLDVAGNAVDGMAVANRLCGGQNHLLPLLGVGKDEADALGQCPAEAVRKASEAAGRRDEKAGPIVGKDGSGTGRIAGDNGHAADHRFANDAAKGFRGRWVDKKVKLRQDGRSFEAFKPDDVLFQAGGRNGVAKSGDVVRMFVEKIAAGENPGDGIAVCVAEIAKESGGRNEKVVAFPGDKMRKHADGGAGNKRGDGAVATAAHAGTRVWRPAAWRSTDRAGARTCERGRRVWPPFVATAWGVCSIGPAGSGHFRMGEFREVYAVFDEVDAGVKRSGEDMPQALLDWSGNGNQRAAASRGKDGVGTAGPVADMPEDAGVRFRQGEDGGNAVCVDDIRTKIEDDAFQGAPGAGKGGK